MLAWGFAGAAFAMLLVGYQFSERVRYIVDNTFFRSVIVEIIAHRILPWVLLLGAVYCGYRAVEAARPPEASVGVDLTKKAGDQSGSTRRLTRPSGSSEQPTISVTLAKDSPGEPPRNPQTSTKTVLPPPEDPQMPVAPPVAMTFRTTVTREKEREPIAGAVVTIEDQSAQSDDRGGVSLSLYHVPVPETQVCFSHESCVPRVFRFDDPAAQREVALASKLRVIVVDFGRPGDALAPTIRIAMEEQLNYCREISVLAGSKRDEIVKQLDEYQEGRALYDKETLNKVGKLHGATYGVFGSIKPGNGGQMVLECSLVQLESGQHLVSTSIVCTREEDLKLRSQQLADRLLASFVK